ncbi:hypothetical protein ACIQNU_29790 [Streptomyces sp. NPDC091292]|uniref:hypothetical protein n=1 Tax=Streptomyces sp. NPDC091292 TaxID=3365991 RepID=UPI003802B4DD
MLTTRGRAATVAAGLFTAAALTLTACGGDSGGGSGGSGNDKIEGAESGGESSPSPSTSATVEKDAPTFDLPSDLKVDVTAKPTQDAAKDALVRDIGYAVRALNEGFAKGDGKTPNMNRYFAMPALSYWGEQIDRLKKDGLTATGTYAYYDFEVTDLQGKSAAVRYCEDQREGFDKEIKSGKIHRTEPSKDDFILNTLEAAQGPKGDWQVRSVSWKKGVEACVRG